MKTDPLATIVRMIQMVILLGLLYLIWPYISNVVWLLVVAFFFSTILLPIVDWLEGRIRYRILAVLSTILVVFSIIIIFLVTFLGQVSSEASSVTRNLNKDKVSTTLNKFSELTVEKLPGVARDLLKKRMHETDFSEKIGAYVENTLTKVTSLAAKIGSIIFFFVMCLIFTVIILLEYYSFKKSLVSLISNRYFEMGLKLIFQIEKQVSSYLHGQLLAASSVAVLSVIGLWLLNVLFHANLSLIIFIGIIAGLANMIPLIGPFAGMVPAIFIAILNNIQNPVALEHYFFIPHIIIMFIIVQQIDNNFVSPMVVGQSVGMHPIMVIIALIIGGNLMGPLGMIVAVPAAGVLKVILNEFLWMIKNSHLLVEAEK